MRIVTWTLAGRHRADAVSTVLRRLSPDIVCLPAAPSARRLRKVARMADLEVLAVGGKGPRTAILAADDVRLLSTGQLVLPTEHRRAPDRVVAQAIVGVGGRRFTVAACQLGAQHAERLEHTDALLAFLHSFAAPAIVGCDTNTSPRGDAARMLGEHFTDAWAAVNTTTGATYPTPDPSARRDVVLLDRELEVVACDVPSDAPVDSASLHRPVVADVADVADGSGAP